MFENSLNLEGPGPFKLPLSDKVVSIDDLGASPFVSLRLRLTTGAEIHIPIAKDQVSILSQLLAVQTIRQGRPPDTPQH